MRKFIIKLNGKSYEVEIEEVGQGTAAPIHNNPSVPTPPVVSEPKVAVAPKTASNNSTPPPQGAHTVKAPMPGTILDIKVQTGEEVSRGQVLAILEAMKMENEIVSPQDGVIVSVQVAKGASVNPGDVLVAIQ